MDKETKNKQKTPALNRLLIVLVVFLVGLIVAGVAVYWYDSTNGQLVTERKEVSNDGNLVKTNQEDIIATVVDKVSPSVVSIVTNVTTRTYFGTASQQAAGTGIIVSKDGYILTNRHVISEASKVQVVSSDGKIYSDVRVVGTDPLNDVAYLQIKNVNDLKPATLGDSSTVRVGQQVIAIGNSLGQYQNTVTSGIISGKGRPVSAGDGQGNDVESLTDLLQTDAAINPGNSGGPLLNNSGQVIGMNTAVAANAQGIGFAIPINAVKGTLKSVLAGKGVQRAYLGVSYVPLNPAIASENKLSVNSGAYVRSNANNGSAVASGSPADKAGIKDGDVITKVNNLQVGPQGGLSSLIGEYAPGDTVELTIVRGDKSITTKVTLAVYSEN